MPDATLPIDPADAAARPTVAVVLNRAAGALLDNPDQTASLRTLFAAVGLDPTLIPNEAGNLPDRVRLALDSGAGTVVVAGGDGTVACAAQVLAGTGVCLGILPFGTMNLLAKDLGIPAGDTEAAMRILAAGQAREIDVGEVNGRVFLCASMLGLPARLARLRERGRGAGPAWRLWQRMARAALRAISRDARQTLELRTDREAVRLRTASLTVTVNALDDGSARLFGRARLDGGELAIYVMRSVRLGDLVRLGLRMLAGPWQRDAAVEQGRVGSVQIDARRRAMRVMNDGEVMLLRPPLAYKIRPSALRVIAPAPGGGGAS